MGDRVSPVVCRRDGERLIVGHVALGNAPAGALQRRGGEGERTWTGTGLGPGEPVHGGNDAGFVCAALDGGGHVLVRLLLDRAGSVEAARLALAEAEMRPRVRVSLLLADAGGAEEVSVDSAGIAEVRALQPELPAAEEASVAALAATLRAHEPRPVEGRAPVAGLVAVLSPGEPARLYIALGPPSCSVFVRHWAGLELVPDESAGPEGSPLAKLAAAVAEATEGDADLRSAARARLDRAEAEALAEGEAAERMAARMDADTDDRGAAVRRLVAQSHAVELALAALRELAVPAPPRGKAAGRPASTDVSRSGPSL